MSLLKLRATLLSLLAMTLVGSFAASSAYAEGGPFWHIRNEGEKGEGKLLSSATEEGPDVQGSGGLQTLSGEVASTKVEIQAKEQQVKGQLWNSADQGQVKLLIKYHEPKLLKPELKGCEVKVGENNEVKVEGHLAWKWNGEKKQLEEKPQLVQKPDWIFLSSQLAQGAKELPKGAFTKITFSGTGCGTLVGSFNVEGSLSGEPTPNTLEEFNRTQTTKYPGPKLQHFWNGKEYVGVETGLKFGGNPAVLQGEDTIKIDLTLESAPFEK
jgi:hypothetical protein